MQTKHRRHAGACLFFAIMLLVLCGQAWAQTATDNPEDEYKKLVKVNEEIAPLGDTPFGESVNVYDGSLSFHVVDITVPGNGPTIQISRTFQADGDASIRKDNASFGDWDIDLPRFSTLTSNASTIIQGPNQIGWLVNSANRTDRCTTFTEPPDQRIGRPGSDPLPPDAWWNEGYLLRIPGVPDQPMLAREPGVGPPAPAMAGLNFTALSKGNWQLACLANTANGQPGEAFLAVGPDGSKYWLNYLVYRPARSYKIDRNLGLMFATRMEDRFGNWITYSYNGPRITSIDASDGRHVTFGYTADATAIAQVTVVAGGASRTWNYRYTPSATGQTLAGVTLPDGSSWTYALSDLTYDVKSTVSPGHCNDPNLPDETILKVGTITAPSGLQGSFEARPTRHARSDVFEYCDALPSANGYERAPRYTNNLALRRKTVTGAGLSTQVWTYSYPVATASWRHECASGGCGFTTYSDVTDPSNNTTRFIFSNRADATEGKAVRTEFYAGGVSASPLRVETYGYAAPNQGPWPAVYGSAFNIYANRDRDASEAPMSDKHVYVDGDDYHWQATGYDAFARATSVHRQRAGDLYAIDETNGYRDDLGRWVIGLPTEHGIVGWKNGSVVSSETVGLNVYDDTSLTLSARYRFGRKVMGYAFNGQGQLASFTDGNGHTTTLGNYKRGIPQSIGYPDGTSQSLVVDDFGQVSSITDQAGATTSYGYNEIGRLASITYPAGDSVAWNGKVFGYALIGASERGINGAHWRRSVSQGDKVQMTYFDAMLRPIVTDTYRNDGNLRTSSRTDYDWRGNKTFQSYPYENAPDLSAMDFGVATSYDALSRPVVSFQHSELGDLSTTTAYLSGAARRVTDPKGNVTTSWFQAFDEPSYDNVTRVEAPEGVVQTIDRDIYGNPLSIAQGGVTKTMVYDGFKRLCRTWEPESNSEVMAYDGADNLAWSVSGASINGSGCGQEQVAESLKTVRAYDAMNRVTSVVYPTGTLPSTFTYDALGNPATATSGSVSWTFGRNKLGLLTAEVLAVDGWSWALGYGYDPNGALSTVLYPDGDVVGYNPDALGRPTTVGGYASGLTYFPDGDVKSYALGSGGSYLAQKNARNLLQNFTFGKGGVPSVSEDFSYDANGNVSQITDIGGNGQRTKVMGYDGLNRLLSATASNLWGTESYTYDTVNNIRSLSNSSGTNTYNYNGTNRLDSISRNGSPVHSFQYDDRGNTTMKDGQVMNFDLANRLTEMPGKGTYIYDAAGRRVKKTTPQGTTYYAYNAAGQLMWEMDPATRIGSEYVYLGKKLVAKASEGIDVLKASQVRTALGIIGIPRLAADGSTIDVTLDIVNTGTRTLTSNSQYPVQMGYHLIDAAGTQAQVEGSINIPADIPVGAHGTMTMHVLASNVLGTGKRIRFSLLQSGVGWFQDWPNNATVDIGPYSACPTAGTGNLCNNVTGLTQAQINVALTIVGTPTLSADGQNVMTTVDIANQGTVTLASAQPHPVNLGNHLIDAAGNLVANDVVHQGIPEIAPGQHAAVVIATPSSQLLGSNRRVQFELVQEGLHWFRDFGFTPLVAGPYVTLGGSTNSNNGAYSLTWLPIAGATSYVLRESINGGAWTIVSNSTATSWSTSGRGTATYAYQVQACASGGCAPGGPSWNVSVLLPPPPPDSASASAPVAGPVTLNWAASATANRYIVQQQVNGGGWATVYDGGGTGAVFGTPASGTYVYQVQACNSSGCSGFRVSNAVGITLPPSSAPGIAGGGTSNNGAYTISWTGVGGATAYNLVESANGGGWQQVQFNGAGSWSTSGKQNGTYVYQVQACNAGGCGPFSGQAVVTVALIPPAPTNVLIHDHIVNTKRETRTMTWNATPLATSYEILDITLNHTFAQLPSTTLSFALEGGSPGQLPYHGFKLRACNAVGCSGWVDGSEVFD